ncbi:MAG: hypothetical protein Fur0043_24730 [Anaerolineales bacterium]
MPAEFVTAENLSKDLLKSIFDAAYMTTSLDKDGDIVIREQCNCIVIPDKEKRRIWLLVQYAFKPTASEAQKMQCVNRINTDYIMARAISINNILRFSYDVILDGDGITPKSLVMLVKRFCSIPLAAVQDYGRDIVE